MDGTFRWMAAMSQDIGGRTEQQDRVAVWQTVDARTVLVAVCDGLGGHYGGAAAAQIVIDTAAELWRDQAQPLPKPRDFLVQIALTAHQRIQDTGQSPGVDPMTTCAMIYADQKIAAWIHVGDSRVYHFNNGDLVSRTADDSAVQILLDKGAIAETEMASHPDQNRLLQALGGDTPPDVHFGQALLQPGDDFLLCSDGLWETIRTHEMAAALIAGNLSAAAEALVREAVRREGPYGDNVTVALLRPAREG